VVGAAVGAGVVVAVAVEAVEADVLGTVEAAIVGEEVCPEEPQDAITSIIARGQIRLPIAPGVTSRSYPRLYRSRPGLS
jgi:hypothetical protein